MRGWYHPESQYDNHKWMPSYIGVVSHRKIERGADGPATYTAAMSEQVKTMKKTGGGLRQHSRPPRQPDIQTRWHFQSCLKLVLMMRGSNECRTLSWLINLYSKL